MGIPPIHTPSKVLEEFPDKVKDKMFLVHVSEDKIPQGKGLKSGPVGLENTVILVQELSEKDSLYRRLNTLSSITLFEDLKIRNVRNLL